MYVFYVTTLCNMKCSYCYEKEYDRRNTFKESWNSLDKEKLAKDMDPTVEIIGGEPLLLMDEVIFLIEELSKINPRVKIYISTNGTIYNKDLVLLAHKYDITFFFSVDGTRFVHNMNRVYKNNKGTYNDIVKNVARYQALLPKNKVAIAMTLSDKSFPFMYDGLIALMKTGVKNISHNLVKEALTKDNKDIFIEELCKIYKNKELYDYYNFITFYNAESGSRYTNYKDGEDTVLEVRKETISYKDSDNIKDLFLIESFEEVRKELGLLKDDTLWKEAFASDKVGRNTFNFRTIAAYAIVDKNNKIIMDEEIINSFGINKYCLGDLKDEDCPWIRRIDYYCTDIDDENISTINIPEVFKPTGPVMLESWTKTFVGVGQTKDIYYELFRYDNYMDMLDKDFIKEEDYEKN